MSGNQPRNTAPTGANRTTGPAGVSRALSDAAKRLNISTNGLGAAQLAIVGGIAAYTIGDAAKLYNRRAGMAAQFQEGLVFPRDLIQNNRNFYVSFSFQKYEKRAINSSPFLRSTGTVRLPLPSNLKDNLSVSYGTESLGPAVGAVLENAVKSGPSVGGAEGFLAGAGRFGNAVLEGAEGTAIAAAQQAGPNAMNAISAYTGLAANPYQTVLFKQPNFKKHSFSWKLMPRDEEESGIIRNLVRTFQFHTSPGVSEGAGLFFSFPSMVIVSLFPSSEFLYRFKPCVIESVDVNYAAGSGPSFFKRSQAPTAVTFSIQLQEIEYWTNNDFEAGSYNDATQLQNFSMRNMTPASNNSPLYS